MHEFPKDSLCDFVRDPGMWFAWDKCRRHGPEKAGDKKPQGNVYRNLCFQLNRRPDVPTNRPPFKQLFSRLPPRKDCHPLENMGSC